MADMCTCEYSDVGLEQIRTSTSFPFFLAFYRIASQKQPLSSQIDGDNDGGTRPHPFSLTQREAMGTARTPPIP